MIEYNHLDLIKERELDWIPVHFSKIQLSDKEEWNRNLISSWVQSKLKGRFSLVKTIAINSDDKLKSSLVIAFEDHSEMTYFMLACPHLRRIQ
jgi:hypothetical protein